MSLKHSDSTRPADRAKVGSLRPNNFDLIRLVAALQVVYTHSYDHFQPNLGWVGDRSYFLAMLFPGVPVFFVVSGFLVSRSFESRTSLYAYARNRVLRIYPGLWVAVAAAVVAAACFGQITAAIAARPVFWLWLAGQLTFVQIFNPSFLRQFGVGVLNGSLWTIPIELGFYILLPAMFRLFRSRDRESVNCGVLLVISTLSFILWAFVHPLASDGVPWAKLVYASPFSHLHMFLLGVVLQRKFGVLGPWLVNRAPLWLGAYLLIGAATALIPAASLAAHASGLFVSRTMLAVTVISIAFTSRELSSTLLRENDISYGVYLYHMPIINILIELGWKGHVAAQLVTALAAVVLASLSWRFVEKPALQMKGREPRADLRSQDIVNRDEVPPLRNAA